jgi:hypothetical protein
MRKIINFIPHSPNNVATKAEYHRQQSTEANHFFSRLASRFSYAFYTILDQIHQLLTGQKLTPANTANTDSKEPLKSSELTAQNTSPSQKASSSTNMSETSPNPSPSKP